MQSKNDTAIEREVLGAHAGVVATESERMTTDESREYLVKFMEQYFTDKTFHRYIRGDETRASVLAGDFAWQMARALRMILAAPAAQAPVQNAEEVRRAALNEAAQLVLSKAGTQISFAGMAKAIRALASKEGGAA